MKQMIVLLVVLLLVVMPLTATAQIAPVGDRALLAGPIYADGALAFQLGLAKKLYGDVWAAGFGRFGQSVEAEGEIVALFHLTSRLTLGPVAAAGVDWSSEPGTETVSAENYFFYAVGGAATFTLPKFANFKEGQWDLWGFFRQQEVPKGDTQYKGGVSGGVGVSYRL